MRSRLPTVPALLGIGVVATLLSLLNSSTGDYPSDAGPTIRALLDGDLGAAIASQPLMGSLSVLVRLPFAAVAELTGGGELLAYQLGSIPCVAAAGVLGLAIARWMERRGAGRVACIATVAFSMVNPLTREALALGHPEELLGGALCAGAVLAALRGHSGRAGVLLGLALATKQWALIAVLPALAAVPAQRLRLAACAGAVAAVLTLPLIAGNLSGFSETTQQAAWGGQSVNPWNLLWPLADSQDRVISIGGDERVVSVRVLPLWLAHLMHPLIVALALPLTAAWWFSRRRTPDDALALLALLFLLRSLLDPVNNVYYHVPFLLSLTAWEGLARRGPPLVSMLCSATIYYALYKAGWADELALRNALYLAATVPPAVWLAVRLYVPRRAARPGVARRQLPAPGTA
ncbi:MAG: glycosyltransferase 87 family protein [Solirubrobacterales bacterium]